MNMELMAKRPKFFKCFVTHITTTDKEVEIWCQTDTTAGTRVRNCIDMNHKILSDLFAINSQNLRPIPTPEVGKNYLTRVKNDLHFHRIVVTHVKPESSQASVLLIDSGIEEWVPFNHLVEFEPLFQIKPLAQKFFLADIETKDNEWDTEEVKRCLQPCLTAVFQCEVIGVTKNTECIRVYDNFFRQPIVQELVQQCNGVLSYPDVGKEIYEAIDLRVGDKSPIKQIEDKQTGGYLKMNGFSESSSDESSPEVNQFVEQNLEEKTINEDIEDVLPLIKIESHQIGGQSEPEVKSNEVISNESQNIAVIEPTIESKDKSEDCVDHSFVGNSNGISEQMKMTSILKQELDVPFGTTSHSVDSCHGLGWIGSAPEQSETTQIEVQMSTQKTDNQNQDSAAVETHSEVVAETKETHSEVVTETDETQLKATDKCDAIPQQMIAASIEGDFHQKQNLNEELNCPDVSDSVVDKLVGKALNVYATSSIKDGSFYCQLSEQFDEITSLIERMTEFYNKVYESNENGLNLNDLKIGDIVAARFTEDQLWYRASVKAKVHNRLTLFYIDFGNEETVGIKECKQLDQQFSLEFMEPQAICCSVIGTTPSAETIAKCVLDMTEIECLFSDCKDKVYSISLNFK